MNTGSEPGVEQRFSTTTDYLDLTPLIVVMLRPDHTVGYINQLGAETLGYRKDEIVGTDWFQRFIPADARENALRRFDTVISGGATVRQYHENALQLRDGQVRTIRWSTTLIKTKDGAIEGALGSGLDITENKALQTYLYKQETEKRQQVLSAVIDAQEAERQHIASELHDNVGQLLTTCKLMLGMELDHQVSPLLQGCFDNLQRAINEIRSLTHHLNPAQLSEIGFVSSLREMIQTLQVAGTYDFTLTIAGEESLRELDAAVALSAFRIVQESLNNIFKHAGAFKIDILVQGSPTSLDIEVADNGRGFVIGSVKKGLGLKNIYNRAELHGGSVYINSTPGEGTLVSICIPL
ncbi:MAG: domain S-box protein [Flaviaesturariibacter sp.]|nr:domain S-box protein [Flaviaesturariibacter sp.]